jgi:hypothetical protein
MKIALPTLTFSLKICITSLGKKTDLGCADGFKIMQM